MTPPTLVHALRRHAAHIGAQSLYVFLGESSTQPPDVLTYRALDERARALAAVLAERHAPGSRALLMCTDGLELLVGFFASLYAGVIVVPVYPPDPTRLQKTLPRVLSIVADAKPTALLTTTPILQMASALRAAVPPLDALEWIAIDGVPADAADRWREPSLAASSIAFLQYTSGSTGDPKGAVVTHGNIVHNAGLLQHEWPIERGSTFATWMPLQHDMGLIGFCLWPVVYGGTTVILPPAAFMRRPLSWLEAVSHHRAFLSGGPNFAYDLAVRKTTPEERARLDLRGWRYALNGAEPVRASTLDEFSEAFAVAGFDRSAFQPCYGLAEATVFVSGARTERDVVVREVDVEALERDGAVRTPRGKSRRLVGVGRIAGDQRAVIVDPETRMRAAPSRVGEIWLQGGSVVHGYWERPEETRAIFEAELADDPRAGAFLRTGDLGFLDGEQLFVTGRLKDLVIVRGVNFYPQDIEHTVEHAAPALRKGCCAAFSVEVADEERLVVVQELERRFHERRGPRDAPPEETDRPASERRKADRRTTPADPASEPELAAAMDPEEIARRIRARVAYEHGIDAFAVVLIRAGAIPKTSSGKIRRRATRAALDKGELDVVYESRAALPEREHKTAGERPEPRATSARGAREIESWLTRVISERCGVPLAQVDASRPVAEYGLDSARAVDIAVQLEQWLGIDVAPTLLWEHPSIAATARALSGAEGAPAVAIAPRRDVGASEPIAVVGIGCRFPGAHGTDAFWRLLEEGRDAVIEVPPDRWSLRDHYDPNPAAPGKSVSRWAGFISGHELFDPSFFGIAPREAAEMDPHQRVLLEVSVEALQDAGISSEDLAGTQTGVFAGVAVSEHLTLVAERRERANMYTATGNFPAIAANRLSYVLDLRGPSFAVDAVCSSSLLAVHLACESLQRGECATAIASGAVLLLLPHGQLWFSKLGVLSPTGRCRAFDAAADGIVLGEGVGAIVLKPLSAAQAAGDRIYGVIRATAAAQDGRSNGLTAPSQTAQEALLRQAYAKAGIDARRVQYIETHGTGTKLGDPIEANAIGNVLGDAARIESARPCFIGSVKTNLGHLSMAGGIAGLIKVLLSLQHRLIPPSLHFSEPNPAIAFDALGLRVPTRVVPFSEEHGPPVAGVTALSFGGTNVHVVVEASHAEPTARPSERPSRESAPPVAPHVVPLSAHTPEAFLAVADQILSLIEREPVSLEDLSYTFARRRTHHDVRLAIVARSTSELREALAGAERGQLVRRPGRVPRLAFVFSGFGAQWRRMGLALAAHHAVFRDSLSRSDALVRELGGWSLLEELGAEPDRSRLSDPSIGQPAHVAIQIALAELWRAWGVRPDIVIGHSAGEIAAAHTAGALTLRDAIHLILVRSNLQQRLVGGGGMVAAELTRAEASEIARSCGVEIAAINGPAFVTFTGTEESLARLHDALARARAHGQTLAVGFPAHSRLIDPLLGDLEAELGDLRPQPASIELLSTVTGDPVRGTELDARYWCRNLREPVRFADAIRTLSLGDDVTVLEIGAHPQLGASVTESFAPSGKRCVTIGSMQRDDDGAATMKAVGALYEQGHAVDWAVLFPAHRRFVRLPPYPWSHERFALPRPLDDVERTSSTKRGEGALVERTLESSSRYGESFAEGRVSCERDPYLRDHRVDGLILVPAAFYLRFALEALAKLGRDRGTVAICDVALDDALVLGPIEVRTLQAAFTKLDGGASSLTISSIPTTPDKRRWTRHVSATVVGREPSEGRAPLDPSGWTSGCEPFAPGDFYALVERWRATYGPRFRTITDLWRGPGCAVGHVPARDLDDGSDESASEVVRLDACLQVVVAAIADHADGDLYLPSAIGRFEASPNASATSWLVRADVESVGEQGVTARAVAVDERGEVVARFEGVQLRRVARTESIHDGFHEIAWLTATEPQAGTPRLGCWLVLADEQGVARALVARLAQAGVRPVTVRRGDRFERVGPREYRIDPSSGDDYARLLAEIRSRQGHRVSAIVHAWALDASQAEISAETLETACSYGPVAASYLVRALQAQAGPGVHPRLWLLTRGAYAVEPDDDVSPHAAALWGAGRVIANEHPELDCTLVDLDAGTRSTDEALAQLLLSEAPWRERAIRDGKGYLARLVPIAIETSEPPQIRSSAAYLVTGGLGGLGLLFARRLAELGAGRIVLAGRTKPDLASAAIVDEIRARGCDVRVVLADVSKEEGAREALAAAGDLPLRGIVHAAAILDDAPATALSPSRYAKVMAPKALAAIHLHRLTRDRALDFFLVCSSASALLGFPGQASYAAANAVCDALAVRRARDGLAATSIAWGPWAQVGGAARLGLEGRFDELGLRPIRPAAGLRAFEAVLARPMSHVAFIPADWSRYASRQDGFGRSALVVSRSEAAAPAIEAGVDRARMRAVRGPERRHLVLEFLREQLGAILHCPPSKLRDDVPVTDLGLDSLTAVELRRRLEQHLSERLPLTSLRRGTSIGDLAEELAVRLTHASTGISTGHDRQMLLDARLDSSIRPRTDAKSSRSPAKNVFVTGATGFLGGFLLADILERTDAVVHALVRAADDSEAQHRLITSLTARERWEPDWAARLRVHAGDLSKPRFGLASERYGMLAEEIDAIYHSGAAVNFLDSYDAIRADNVLGTLAAIELAVTSRAKHLHHISTAYTFFFPERPRRRVLESDSIDGSSGFVTGYQKTKWVAEKLVTTARSRGVPISIYRPSWIEGHSKTGSFNTNDFLCNIIRACAALGCAPELDIVADLVPVDYVSRAIVELSQRAGGTYNLVSVQPPPWSDLLALLDRAGLPLERLSFDEWKRVLDARAETDRQGTLPVVSAMFSDPRTIDFLAKVPVFDCAATIEALEGSDVRYPPIDADLLAIYVQAFRRSGFID